MTYGGEYRDDEDDWYQSPVQSSPLTVFPPEVRAEIVEALNDRLDDHIPVVAEGRLDPFCREAYDYLEERYRREGVRDLFSAVTGRRHLRVKNYVVEVGQGIGVLHSEDDGQPEGTPRGVVDGGDGARTRLAWPKEPAGVLLRRRPEPGQRPASPSSRTPPSTPTSSGNC